MTLRWAWNDDATLRSAAQNFISLRKPGEVYRANRRLEDAVHLVPTATTVELARVHDLKHLFKTVSCEAPNGFGNTSVTAMRQVMAANGVMIGAIKLALEHPGDVVCAPVGGFHHAKYAEAAGYCTFNGLLAGIVAARVEYPVPRVLIIDGDAHYGDGTDDIINKLVLGGITNLTHKDRGPNSLSKSIWEMQIRGLMANHTWDLVIYQAGADCAFDDPYGSGYLTDDDWEARDRLVFQSCRRAKVPCVFNLAGGYNGARTLALHAKTIGMARMMYASAPLDVQQQTQEV